MSKIFRKIAPSALIVIQFFTSTMTNANQCDCGIDTATVIFQKNGQLFSAQGGQEVTEIYIKFLLQGFQSKQIDVDYIEQGSNTLGESESDTLALVLNSLPTGKQRGVFLICDKAGYATLENKRGLLDRFNLEVINPSLISVPFLVYGHHEGSTDTKQEIVYFTLPDYRFWSGDDGQNQLFHRDVARFFQNKFGLSVKLFPESSPADLASYLARNKSTLVAFLDQEPSSGLQEFLEEYQHLNADNAPTLYPFNMDFKRLRSLELSKEFSSTKILQPNFDADSPSEYDLYLLGLGSESLMRDRPILLTNIDNRCCINQVVRDAYMGALPIVSSASNQSGPGSMSYSLMIDALAKGDFSDPLDSLFFLSYLYSSNSSPIVNREMKRRAQLFYEGRFGEDTSDEIELLAQTEFLPAEDSVRVQFSRDSTHLYKKAVLEINSSGTIGSPNLVGAKQLLGNLIKEPQFNRNHGGRGLWSVSDYNPYWQLIRLRSKDNLGLDPEPPLQQ